MYEYTEEFANVYDSKTGGYDGLGYKAHVLYLAASYPPLGSALLESPTYSNALPSDETGENAGLIEPV